jgi:hypothetical protein
LNLETIMYSKLYKLTFRVRHNLTVALGVFASTALMTQAASAQTPVSPDPQVRVTQQWEEILLTQDFDYLQLTPQQCKDMLVLADYARTRLDEVEQQRLRLQASVQQQHAAMLKGALPSNSDQQEVLQKQRQIQERQEAVGNEIVERVAPKLGAILSRKQTVRAWLLMQNKIPQAEPKRVALTDPISGFVLPQMEGKDAIEEIVKASLRQNYAPDVVENGLTPWEFASLGGLAGGLGPGGPGGPGLSGQAGQAKALQAVQEMDPRMAGRMLMLGQRMLKQFTGGGDPNAPQTPPVPPEVRTKLNTDAAALRKSIETDPEAYLSKASGNQMLEVLKPLARRLFLSPRLKEVLTVKSKG